MTISLNPKIKKCCKFIFRIPEMCANINKTSTRKGINTFGGLHCIKYFSSCFQALDTACV